MTNDFDKKNINTATATIKTEIENLQLLQQQFNNKKFSADFLKVLNEIENCKGRVLFSGIGKSGIICKKVSTIFSSIGVASFFIHPVEAIHGDLGCICKDDILIAVSCSGNTIELQNIVNFCNKQGIKTIAVACKTNSWLEKKCQNCIVINMQNEAIKNFPIPTTSSILTLAVFDALTACLVENKNLTYKKYGELHCGGKIGEAMKKKVK